MRRGTFLASLAAIVALQAHARAGDKALAEQLFRKAQAVMQGSPTQAEVHQACQWFKESNTQDSALNTQVALAACYEKEGKNVSAWGLYTDVFGSGGPAAQYAKDRADALQAKGFLKIRLEAKALPPDAKVILDGDPVGAAALNTDIDADPGEHSVVVSMPGKKESPKSFTLTPEKSPLAITLDLPAEDAAPLSAPPPSAPEERKGGLSGLGLVGLITAGAGVVAIGIGSGFGIMALGKKSDSSPHCNIGGKPNDCDAAGVGLRNDAVAAGNVSTALFVVGGVLAAGGVVLWLTAPSAKAKIAFDGRQILVVGTF